MILFTLLTCPLQVIKQKRQSKDSTPSLSIPLLNLYNGLETLLLLNTHLLLIDTDYPFLATTIAKSILSPLQPLFTLQSTSKNYSFLPIRNMKLYSRYFISWRCYARYVTMVLTRVVIGLLTQIVIEGSGVDVYDDLFLPLKCFGLVIEGLVGCPMDLVNSRIDYESTIGRTIYLSSQESGNMINSSNGEVCLKDTLVKCDSGKLKEDCIHEMREPKDNQVKVFNESGFFKTARIIYTSDQIVVLDGLDETEIQLLGISNSLFKPTLTHPIRIKLEGRGLEESVSLL